MVEGVSYYVQHVILLGRVQCRHRSVVSSLDRLHPIRKREYYIIIIPERHTTIAKY